MSSVEHLLDTPHRWKRIWIITTNTIAVAYIGWEIAARNAGVQAGSVADTPQLWSQLRERASSAGKDGVILVGASRIQLGVNLQVLSQYTKQYPIQLAIDGSTFVPVLEDLAQDENINGTVIVSWLASGVRNPGDRRGVEWLAFHEKIKQSKQPLFYRKLETVLQNTVNRVFATRTMGIKPYHLLDRALHGDPTVEGYLTTYPDRSRQGNYTNVDTDEMYADRLQKQRKLLNWSSVSDDEFDRWLNKLEGYVNQIQLRGGRVVFVRFPTDKGMWEIDEKVFPRNKYWRRLVETTSADTIHFKDHEELSKYSLPDGSHLDFRDAVPFTKSLAEILFGSSSPQNP